jgi:hypothetical protein
VRRVGTGEILSVCGPTSSQRAFRFGA